MRLFPAVLTCVAFTTIAYADNGYITPFAGNGVRGNGGVGGPAVNANLYLPTCTVRDLSGNTYISDSGNGRVYRVDASSGVMTVVTGPGVQDTGFTGRSAGNGSVEIVNYCVAVDSLGNVFTTGGSSNRIYRLDAVTGQTSTFAGNGVSDSNGDGGPASAAAILAPVYLTFDSLGNMYIVESLNKIRRIDAATGIITTVAGTLASGFSGDGGPATAAQLYYPIAVSVDAAGNLFISDTGNNRVRRVDSATGIISTFAGTGVTSDAYTGGVFNGDNIPATSANVSAYGTALDANGNLFIATLDRIRRVDAATGIITTVAGAGYYGQDGTVQATSALLRFATFPTVLPNGNLLISEIASTRPGVRSIAYPGPLTLTTTTLNLTTDWTAGKPVALAATIAPLVGVGLSSGPVQFWEVTSSAHVPLGFPVPVINGTAISTGPVLSAGNHNIEANYGGDFAFGASSSARVTKAVKYGVTISYSTQFVVAVGQSVNYSVTVTPSGGPLPLTGTIQLLDGSTVVGSVPVCSSCAATLSTTFTTAGLHNLTYSYSGDANFASATSTINQQVSITTSLMLTALPTASAVGQPVTLTAAITPSSTVGSIQFFDSGNVLGTATLSGGTASLSTSFLTPGTHSLSVYYPGDATTSGAIGTLTLTVSGTTNTTLTLPNPQQQLSAPVTMTAQVTPTGAIGTVQFLEGATVLGTATLNTGVATLTLTNALALGTHPIQAVYQGGGSYSGSSSAIVNQVIVKNVPVASLGITPSPSVTFGQSVGLVAQLSPLDASGTVQFLDGATVLGTLPITTGTATFNVSDLSVGTHALQIVYSGNASYANVSSTVVNLLISKASSTVALSATPNPSSVNQSVTFTTTVTPSIATGTVQFMEGATVLGASNVTSGNASLSISTLPAGTHSVLAIYSGDASYTTSTSSAITQTVNKITSTVAFLASPNPSTFGQNAILTATLTPTAATGTVQLLDGATVLGTAAVNAGTATFSTNTNSLTVGTHSLQAVYSGDSTYAGVSSTSVNQVVNKATTTVTVASSQNPADLGQTVTLSATLLPASATGTMQFLDGATVISTVTVTNGTAQLSISTLASATHSITAVYSGDSTYLASTSAVLSQKVKQSAGLTIGLTPSPAVVGQSVRVSANMLAAATGTVTFTDGGTTLATVPVVSGSASFTTTSLAAGVHALGVSYSGDSNYMSISSSVNETVFAASTLQLQVTTDPSVVGQSVTFRGVVTPTSATGTVQFFDGGVLIGTAPVAGIAQFATSALSVGTHTITASYSGDSADAPATSNTLTTHVRNLSTISLASNRNPAVLGQSITYTATVTPSNATGTIQFIDGAVVLATGTVAAGRATFTTTQLTGGVHSITAFYSGDSANGAATSSVVTQTITVPVPTAPSNLVATAASSSQINLTWNASTTSGVTYNVYASTASGFTPSAANRIASSVATTSYNATGLAVSTTYYFRVTAVNTGGESAVTGQANAKTTSPFSCHVTYSASSQGSNGFGSTISIKNTSTTAVNSWILTWTWAGNQTITQAWNATYTQTGANAKLTSMSYNQTINPNASVTGIGFNASYSGTNQTPTAFYVNGTLCQ